MTVSLREKNGYFYAVASYKANGAQKQKWVALNLPVKNNKRKAEARLDEIKRDFEEKYLSPASDMLFVTYIKRWLEKKKNTIELSTWEGYQIYAEKHIIPYFESKKLSLADIKPQHIKEYYEHKYASGRLDGKPGGLSIASIKKHGIVLKEVFNSAVVEDLVKRNPASGVRLPAKEVKKVKGRFLTAAEAGDVIRAFEGHRLKALVCTTLYYALRRSEVLGLRWSAVDFRRGTITINHTVVKNCTIVRKDSTKTESSAHTYQLIDDVRDILLKQREAQQRNQTLFGSGYFKSDYVFTWEDGRLFRPDYITDTFVNMLARHDLPKMRFHDLRHSTASILYDKGWSLKDIQSWLRHSSVDVTADIYTHITNDRRANMAKSLNSIFEFRGEDE